MKSEPSNTPISPLKRSLRIGVIGANGRLGQAVVSRFSALAQPIAITRDQLDLSNPSGIEELVLNCKLDMVVITAAMTAVDDCEKNKELAYSINSEGPGKIARVCAEHGIKVVYISTDFVFDGSGDRPYREGDKVNPISVYGASKLKGEQMVLAASGENLVVRVSWLYGAASPAFPEWIIRQATMNDTLALPAEKIGSPTASEDVAAYLEPLLGLEGAESAKGIVHLCNSGSCSWREWGQFCLDEATNAGAELRTRTIGVNRMEDIAAFVAKRPRMSALDNSLYCELTGVRPRSWESALSDHLSSMELFVETPKAS
ncbi:dTDP-4-dehydrorhamnose reductase [Haloferula sp.]|uniref:dTDP-4-dehydrorhamnose reductase n=1 Tax=Haloferula sp. TaxID=2497595 RepID=UPI003C77EA47